MGFGSVAWDGEHLNGDERQCRDVKATSHHAEPSPAAPPRTRRHPQLVPKCPLTHRRLSLPG